MKRHLHIAVAVTALSIAGGADAQPSDLPIPAATTTQFPPGVSVKETKSGRVYVNSHGLTLYGMDMRTLVRWTTTPLTYCKDACAQQWQPLLAPTGSTPNPIFAQPLPGLGGGGGGGGQLEKQLDVELTKPEPLQACVVPNKLSDRPVTAEIETVMKNHELMTDLLVMALACDQTRVFNMMFNNGASSLTKVGSTITHHQLTHEEVLDNRLGYQPNATFFLVKSMEAWVYFVAALDKVKEGDRTLLDNTLVFAHSETEFAKFHSIDNLPMMTAGSAGGRIRTGQYVDGAMTPISRVGLTLQQVMGVSVDRWGTKSMETTKTIKELLA